MESYENQHKCADIYVVASGKSVDYISTDFYKNKITIGVNQVYKKIQTNYLVRKEHELIDEVIKNTKDQIIFISKGAGGGTNSRNQDYIVKKYGKNNKRIVVFNHEKNHYTIPDLPKDRHSLVVSHSTITSAIHLAAYMGASNIILIGHDCGMLDGECNFTGYHTDETYKIAWKNGQEEYKKWTKTIEQHTIILKRLLKSKYGCNIYSLNPFVSFNLEGHKYT